MADKKISALTAATTPLAGTEVLPIVQGGSTVKVSIDNVTKGRTVNATTFDTDIAAAKATLSGTTLAAAGSNTNVSLRIDPKGSGGVGVNVTPVNKVQIFQASTASPPAAGAAGHAFALGETGFGLASGTLFSGSSYLQATRWDGSAVNYNIVLQPNGGDVNTGAANLVIGTANKGITNSTGSVALNFSTVGTALTGGSQSVLTGSFNNVGAAQTVTPDDTRGGSIVITAIQPGIGSTTYTLPFVKRGGTAAIGTPSKAILTADPLLSVVASGGDIVVTPIAGNTYITYAIYYTPLGA